MRTQKAITRTFMEIKNKNGHFSYSIHKLAGDNVSVSEKKNDIRIRDILNYNGYTIPPENLKWNSWGHPISQIVEL